ARPGGRVALPRGAYGEGADAGARPHARGGRTARRRGRLPLAIPVRTFLPSQGRRREEPCRSAVVHALSHHLGVRHLHLPLTPPYACPSTGMTRKCRTVSSALAASAGTSSGARLCRCCRRWRTSPADP